MELGVLVLIAAGVSGMLAGFIVGLIACDVRRG